MCNICRIHKEARKGVGKRKHIIPTPKSISATSGILASIALVHTVNVPDFVLLINDVYFLQFYVL